MKKNDYLIVGAGLFGSTFAYLMSQKNKKCLVIDCRKHVGGNCYTENMDGINVHQYGPHIFHTKDKNIWKFINQFAEFNNFRYKVKALYRGNLYSFPINLNTLYDIYKINNPEDAKEIIKSFNESDNFEEACISFIGKQLYFMFIYGYTRKQWGCEPKELPGSIIKRIPFRVTFDDNYYAEDEYQGIPKGGYTNISHKMLANCDLKLNVDYFADKSFFDSLAEKVVYTGSLDELCSYTYGKLNYRSLTFSTTRLEMSDYQGIATINYTDVAIPRTRVVEHKYFEFGKQPFTIITKEYPSNTGDPFYPMNWGTNSLIYNKYLEISKQDKNLILGGRLAEYKYMNMDDVIKSAMEKVKEECKKNNEDN